ILLNDQSQQFDIIYVDKKNGTASIQHNSAVLRNVLSWVNAQKQANNSTHQNVILAQSMGDLITRYCLKRMDDDNVPHDVRLFVAHDSPLQGANFPISMQYFARHMYDLYTDSPVYPVVEAIPTILNFAELMSLGLINVDL